MDILKLFYEEPLHLEALSADADPDARRRETPHGTLEALLHPARYYRLYLAGTDLAADRVGASVLNAPEAFAVPLAGVFAGKGWTALRAGDGEPTPVEDAPLVLREPDGIDVLAVGEGQPEAEAFRAVAAADRRYAVAELRRLLDAGFAVLFPEPAHHGSDWSVFSPEPLKDRLVEAFREHPVPGLRRFAAPYQTMRAEHRFYFERWALDDPPAGVEEIE